MFRRYYQAKKLLRIVGSYWFFIILVCGMVYYASFKAVAAGEFTMREAMAFTAGTWFFGALMLIVRVLKTIVKRW